MDNSKFKYKLLQEESDRQINLEEEDGEDDEILFTFKKFKKVKPNMRRKCGCYWPWLPITILFMSFFLLVLFQAFVLKSPQSWILLENQDTTNNLSLISKDQQSSSSFYNFLVYIGSKLGMHTSTQDDLSDKIPLRVQLDISQTFRLVEEESNLAATYWNRWNSLPDNNEQIKPNVKYCNGIQLTDPYKVKHNNLHWQQFDATSEKPNEETITMFLYNAYYDKRISGAPVVKLIAMNNQHLLADKRKWWCLLWFEKTKQPVLVNVSDFYYIWPPSWSDCNQYGYYHPQLITCPIPKEYAQDIPRAVSLQARGDCAQVEKEPSNVLRVVFNEKRENRFKKPSIGVCVQAFRFGTYDVSVRIVEWLEMIRLLGADKVYFYVYGANDNIWKVLKHYQIEGLVDWRHLTLPGHQVNVNSLYNTLASYLFKHFWPTESLELNDCLYRNLYRHDYVAVIDVDEVIMPQNVTNWHELIKQIQNGLSDKDRQQKAFYSSRHSHVCEMSEETEYSRSDIKLPEYLYMLRHTYRANVLGPTQNNKCIHRTDLVTAVHNHFPMRCINTIGHLSCPGVLVEPSQSILMHYRRGRSTKSEEKSKSPDKCSIHDRITWRYFDKLNEAVRTQLENIFVV